MGLSACVRERLCGCAQGRERGHVDMCAYVRLHLRACRKTMCACACICLCLRACRKTMCACACVRMRLRAHRKTMHT